ncbi:hypothetical protein EV356DRAFT_518003 [Viridothelium virens]|uniref:Rhodopsin domain-containing protein n=1 Tax=Viridothelium virens TaxID=1048519 RepID=A0A6A6HKS9_VIRVR|nr:hypothetical protein EV356DRAFT_518003 [Viridothelium virens]
MYSPASLTVTAVMLPLFGVIAVFLRFWVRLHLQPSYVGADDVFIVIGSLLVCGMGALQITSTVLGDLSQDTTVTPQKDYLEQKFNYINVVIEKPAYGAIKLSVLFFYRRVFSIRDRFRLFNNIMLILIAIWAIAFFWSEVFACGTDFAIQWKARETAAAHCTNHGLELLIFAVTDVVGDVLIVIMPFFSIQDLKMTRREKWGVSLVFVLGTLSTAAAAMRLGFVAEAYSIGVSVSTDSTTS